MSKNMPRRSRVKTVDIDSSKVAKLSARRLMIIAEQRRLPKMHWRWRRRGRAIVRLLERRFGSVLPVDDAGMDAVNLLAQHYLLLQVDAERVTRANLRLWAPWLAETGTESIIKAAKTPSAAQVGKVWRVTAEEVAAGGLESITAFTETQQRDRNRQASRRRKAGASTRRGRPGLDLPEAEKTTRKRKQSAQSSHRHRAANSSGQRGRPKAVPAWKLAGASSKAAYYRNLKSETKNPSCKKSHAPSYIGGMKRDEFCVTEFKSHGPVSPTLWIPAPPGRTVIVPPLSLT